MKMMAMDEKKEMLKPFVAGLLSCGIHAALEYSFLSTLTNARYQKHPEYVRRCIRVKMIPGMVLIDAFAYSEILGFYEIMRRKAIARNDGVQPSLYEEGACGLIAGAAGAYLSYPLARACYDKQVESMGPIAERWRHPSKWSDVGKLLRNGGPWLKTRTGLGMGMVATYNPSLHYLMESRGFSEVDAKSGAWAISALCAAVCASVAPHASSLGLGYAREARRLGGFGFFSRLSGLCIHEVPKVMLFWAILEQVHKY